MDTKFHVLGFGAEVTAPASQLRHVTDGDSGEKVPIEHYGTRHRSAFRFCSAIEAAVAFVVSQDGGPKAVKKIGQDVVMWPNVRLGRWSL